MGFVSSYKAWYPSKQLWKESVFDKELFIIKKWYENGQIAEQGDFSDYFKIENWKYWDEQGNEIIIQKPKKP